MEYDLIYVVQVRTTKVSLWSVGWRIERMKERQALPHKLIAWKAGVTYRTIGQIIRNQNWHGKQRQRILNWLETVDMIPKNVLELVVNRLLMPFEGFREKPYQDSVGVWTIGYGSTHDLAGEPVSENTPPVDREQAMALVERDLVAVWDALNEAVTVPLNINQEAALLDFGYNLGIHALTHSTMMKRLNAQEYSEAADQILLWDHAGGKVLPGLLRRREAERELFVTPIGTHG